MIDVASGSLPKSPVSLSPGDEVLSHVYSKAASISRRPRRRLLRGAWPFRLYLRRPAIDKQLDPSHETGIVRRKKKCRRGDLMRLTDSAHRDDRDDCGRPRRGTY